MATALGARESEGKGQRWPGVGQGWARGGSRAVWGSMWSRRAHVVVVPLVVGRARRAVRSPSARERNSPRRRRRRRHRVAVAAVGAVGARRAQPRLVTHAVARPRARVARRAAVAVVHAALTGAPAAVVAGAGAGAAGVAPAAAVAGRARVAVAAVAGRAVGEPPMRAAGDGVLVKEPVLSELTPKVESERLGPGHGLGSRLGLPGGHHARRLGGWHQVVDPELRVTLVHKMKGVEEGQGGDRRRVEGHTYTFWQP